MLCVSGFAGSAKAARACEAAQIGPADARRIEEGRPLDRDAVFEDETVDIGPQNGLVADCRDEGHLGKEDAAAGTPPQDLCGDVGQGVEGPVC
jgi:hypothetical protein